MDFEAVNQFINANPSNKLIKDDLDEAAKLQLFIAAAQTSLSAPRAVLRKELNAMTNVLKELGYLDNDNHVTPKGEIASRINAIDELLATELLLDGVLNGLDPIHMAALACGLAADAGAPRSAAEAPQCAPDLNDLLDQVRERNNRIKQV